MQDEPRYATGDSSADMGALDQTSLVPDNPAETAKAWDALHIPSDPTARTVTKEDGLALLERISKIAQGGGDTQITVRSSSTGNLRWARNRPTTSGITMIRSVRISRMLDGKWSSSTINRFDDESITNAVRTIERRMQSFPTEFVGTQSYTSPPLWSDGTLNASALDRSKSAREGVAEIATKKCLAAGYVETDIQTWGIFNTLGLNAYAAVSGGLFQITARDPLGNGSGWSGQMEVDWTKLDTSRLSKKAMDACAATTNPKAVEPGRYTTILHPDVVAAMLFHLYDAMDRRNAENNPKSIFGSEKGVSRIGTKVIDERLSLVSDPMDPRVPFIPFDGNGYPMKPTTWIEKGVLKELSYDSNYAREKLGTAEPLPLPFSSRIINNGPATSLDEMIATTKRGIFVQRVGISNVVDMESLQIRTTTQDGLWLIENGQMKVPAKNMHILESPMAMFNRVLQVGETDRAWGRRYLYPVDHIPSMALHEGRAPVAVPPMKVEDFNFVMLADAL